MSIYHKTTANIKTSQGVETNDAGSQGRGGGGGRSEQDEAIHPTRQIPMYLSMLVHYHNYYLI